MSAVVADWKRPRTAEPVTIRCPACNTVFTRVLGRLNPKAADPKIEIECVCKNRRCLRNFVVKVTPFESEAA